MSFVNLKLDKKLTYAFSTIIVAVGAMCGTAWYCLSDIQTATGWDASGRSLRRPSRIVGKSSDSP